MSDTTVRSGAGNDAGCAIPVLRPSESNSGNVWLRSSWPVRYWLVHSVGSASSLTQYAWLVSVSNAYINWVGLGWTWSNVSTDRPVARQATVNTPATVAGVADHMRLRGPPSG